MMDQQEIMKKQLGKLLKEHRDLDDVIRKMMREAIVDQLAIKRLKKRKLLLKDQITKIKSILLPDIIA
ncbi:MAG: YdcH family protein [Candidatus Nucleicultricaceae bacterium]